LIDETVMHTLHQAVLITGALTLVFAALHDIAARTIPNTASAILACLGLALHAADGTILFSLLVGFAVFGTCALCWMRGWMGGGDVKLLTAAALFVPPGAVGSMIVATSLFGGVLAVIYLIAREIARRIALPTGRPPRNFLARVIRAEHWRLLRGAPLPYGSAIAAGTLFSLFPG
jgi:prepilin peptidase CpaA